MSSVNAFLPDPSIIDYCAAKAGIIGMRVGGKRWLRIPPDIAYGSFGMNNVPGNSIVDFEVELLGVK